jgi:transposase InsO family protein
MSRKGNCWDNSVAESFFKTLKTELVYHTYYYTKEQAKLSVFEYIEGWYNKKRRHSERIRMDSQVTELPNNIYFI